MRSPKYRAFGKVEFEFELDGFYVDDGYTVEEEVQDILNRHLGIHDYTYSNLFGAGEFKITISDIEEAL
jgi:hypothetical protein